MPHVSALEHADRLRLGEMVKEISLCGFSDTSLVANWAMVYARYQHHDSSVSNGYNPRDVPYLTSPVHWPIHPDIGDPPINPALLKINYVVHSNGKDSTRTSSLSSIN